MLLGGNLVNRFGAYFVTFIALYMIHRGFQPAEAGLALAANRLGALQGTMLGGWLADRLGRRKAIVLSMFGSAALTASVPSLGGLLPILAIAALIGCVGQVAPPAMRAMLIDVAPPMHRVMAFAMARVAVNAGMAGGPAMAGFLASSSYTWLFVADAGTSCVFGLVVLLGLDEPAHVLARRPASGGAGYRTVVRDTHFMVMLAGVSLATVVYIQATVTLPLHVLASSLSVTTYGFLISLNGLLVILFELVVTTYIRHLRPQYTMAAGVLLQGLGFFLCIWARSAVALAGTVVVWSAGEILAAPAEAYPGSLAEPEVRGRYQAAWAFAQSVGSSTGSLLGGLLFAVGDVWVWAACGLTGVLAASFAVASSRLRPRQSGAVRTG